MRDWRQFLPEKELAIYKNAGFTKSFELGKRMALVVIDCTFSFIGSRPDQSIEEAMQDYPTACGPVGWESLPRVAKLIQACRDRSIPVIYTRNDLKAQAATGLGATKGAATRKPVPMEQELQGNEFPAAIQPLPNEWIIEKVRASAFHGTLLETYLTKIGVDTLLVCGTTTSGCVRASAVDGFSSGFNVFVIDDCCFDRAETPHLANLWDLNAKYATVVSHEMILQNMEPVNAR